MSKSKQRDQLPPFGTLVRVSDPPEEEERGCVRVKTVKGAKNGNDDDTHEENGVLFWVNKSGFPIDNRTWDRMWDHVSKIHPDGYSMINKIRNKSDLPQIPIQQAPLNFPSSMPVQDRLDKVQNYMKSLQYNHTGTQFFEIRKQRPLSGLMDSAREMIKEALPIKCLEAVILGLFLTNGFLGVERFPLSFKSVFGGNVHRHVVLGIYYAGKYGSIGMSRRDELMYKPVVYKSLSELVFEFERSYNMFKHEVKKVKVGLPVPHDPHSYEFINWKALTINMNKLSPKEVAKDLDVVAKEIRTKAQREANDCTVVTLYSSRKSRSWVTQPTSPRKTITSIDMTTGRDAYATNSLKQASKIYRSQTTVGSSENGAIKRKSTDPAEYQIRI
ncbi:tubulinyl-Tyr carboxypeptidase 2-like isoform X2 [Argopecten irradians]|uniref:tubulinyl-Tyr carboxypeptidase 2-like isoform X2 n=1 Tax=Argopecten irradians TaxID=31199 RepID=UPI003714E346